MNAILLDSNIIIYAAKPDDTVVRALVGRTDRVYASDISVIETLGFKGISDRERDELRRTLANCLLLRINQPVIDTAVQIRQQRRMSLGDAIIAATAVVHGLTLATHNIADFGGILDLDVIDPFAP